MPGVKHNVARHTCTNVDGYDADITQVPIVRLMPMQARRPWYRLQHYYIWALYCLMALRGQTVGDVAAFVRGSVGTSALRLPHRWDLAGLVGGKLIFVGWAIVVPFLVYPWWAVLAGYLVYSMTVSLIMAVTFQLAHCVEEAEFTSSEQLASKRRLWAVHEVETTVNFCPRNAVLSWVVGWLNYQIEHHLFPRVPHTHYPHIPKIVKRNAELHGVRYATHPSPYAALGSHFRHLRTIGRIGVPITLEMG
jgi:linoleoyl-CoA desaturase